MKNKTLVKSIMSALMTMLLILVSVSHSTSTCIMDIYSLDCTIGGSIDNAGLYTAANEPTTCEEGISVNGCDIFGLTYVTVLPCTPVVTIHPTSTLMELGETQIFTASTTCNGVSLDGTYTWSVDGGTLDTVHGDTVLYTATEEGVYTLTVTDTSYHVTATAIVEILFGGVCFLDIFPDTLLRSRWITLPAWIIIPGNCHNTNFDAATTVEFWETASIIKMPKLVINNNHILQLLFLRPSWLVGVEYEFVEVVVKAGGEVATGDLYIEMLPFPLDEQKILK